MEKLGKLKKSSDLRMIWPHEAADFTKWLSEKENLELLGDTIGLDVVLEERESAVGGFSVDLYAQEEGTGRRIIVENQLEETDHDHLGKIITYASGKNAEVVVWIVKHARDEHRQAIEWLNQHTDENIAFFLLEMELWRIGESPWAPHFNIIERPNDWVKATKGVAGLSSTKKLQLEFWEAFCDYAFRNQTFAEAFRRRKARPQHWYDLGLGISACHLSFTVNTQKKEAGIAIYIPENDDFFQFLKDRQKEIEASAGQSLQWREADKARQIGVKTKGDIKQGPEAWAPLFDWFIENALRLRDVALKFCA